MEVSTSSALVVTDGAPSAYIGTDLFISVSDSLTAADTVMLSIISMKLVAMVGDSAAATATVEDKRAALALLIDRGANRILIGEE